MYSSPDSEQRVSPTHTSHRPVSDSAKAAQPGENRRADRRFAVKGSTVKVPCKSFYVCGAELDVTRMFLGLVPWGAADGCDVLNLSKGGLCFETTRAMVAGEQLELSLWIPGRKGPLELKGEVRWCKTGKLGIRTVGVRFAPFGSSRGSNSVEALNVLRELEATHD